MNTVVTKTPPRVALVTGASKGIGRAIAERLAADGAVVAVHYGRDEAAAARTVSAIEEAGGQAFAVRAELGVPGDVDTLFAALGAALAQRELEPALDVVVNNAGCGNPEIQLAGSIDRLTPEQFDEVFAINVKAPLFIIQRALPMVRDGGRVISISSVATRVAMPHQIGYAMSKGSLEVMTRTLANAVGGRGITVNAVTPGATDSNVTDILKPAEIRATVTAATALGRVGQPTDIADVVGFLAADAGRWVTGSVIDASGGLWLGPLG